MAVGLADCIGIRLTGVSIHSLYSIKALQLEFSELLKSFSRFKYVVNLDSCTEVLMFDHFNTEKRFFAHTNCGRENILETGTLVLLRFEGA